jgi:hypothetical protein
MQQLKPKEEASQTVERMRATKEKEADPSPQKTGRPSANRGGRKEPDANAEAQE